MIYSKYVQEEAVSRAASHLGKSSASWATVSGRGRAIMKQVLWVRFLIWVTTVGNHLTRNPSESDTHLYCSLWEKIIEEVRLKYLRSTEQTLIKLGVELHQRWICSDYCNCCSSTWWQSNVHADIKMSTMRLLKIGSILFWKEMNVSLKVLHT